MALAELTELRSSPFGLSCSFSCSSLLLFPSLFSCYCCSCFDVYGLTGWDLHRAPFFAINLPKDFKYYNMQSLSISPLTPLSCISSVWRKTPAMTCNEFREGHRRPAFLAHKPRNELEEGKLLMLLMAEDLRASPLQPQRPKPEGKTIARNRLKHLLIRTG